MLDGSGWYQIKIERGVVLVILHGEFDIVESRDLEQGLAPLVDQAGARVEVDMSDVAFFGSTGLRAILASHERAAVAGSSLVVTNPSSSCVRLFDVAGVSDRLLGGGSGTSRPPD